MARAQAGTAIGGGRGETAQREGRGVRGCRENRARKRWQATGGDRWQGIGRRLGHRQARPKQKGPGQPQPSEANSFRMHGTLTTRVRRRSEARQGPGSVQHEFAGGAATVGPDWHGGVREVGGRPVGGRGGRRAGGGTPPQAPAVRQNPTPAGDMHWNKAN